MITNWWPAAGLLSAPCRRSARRAPAGWAGAGPVSPAVLGTTIKRTGSTPSWHGKQAAPADQRHNQGLLGGP